ncbi:hypothetical protein HK105_208046 [Polyrhizophydium stewartii]|uniref:Uncharacterized protein n=1 Tax=Polyrhizophydium stewartii TaxID=2732419 RepID=A0ABR4MZ05_9FUNG
MAEPEQVRIGLSDAEWTRTSLQRPETASRPVPPPRVRRRAPTPITFRRNDHKRDLASFTVGELEDMLARSQSVLDNDGLLQKLPDKGDSLRAKHKEIESWLERQRARQRELAAATAAAAAAATEATAAPSDAPASDAPAAAAAGASAVEPASAEKQAHDASSAVGALTQHMQALGVGSAGDDASSDAGSHAGSAAGTGTRGGRRGRLADPVHRTRDEVRRAAEAREVRSARGPKPMSLAEAARLHEQQQQLAEDLRLREALEKLQASAGGPALASAAARSAKAASGKSAKTGKTPARPKVTVKEMYRDPRPAVSLDSDSEFDWNERDSDPLSDTSEERFQDDE